MKLIILDRDGVINHDSDKYIKSPDEWKPIKGSLEAIARLCQWGYRVVVATNQSGVGRGFFDMDTLNAIHEKMTRAVSQVGGRIDAVFYCTHTDADRHSSYRQSFVNTGYGIKLRPGFILMFEFNFIKMSCNLIDSVGSPNE